MFFALAKNLNCLLNFEIEQNAKRGRRKKVSSALFSLI